MTHGYFEYIDEKSAPSLKFWEIAKEGTRVTIRQGKLGTVGKIETQEYSDVEACTKQVEKKTQAIISKGYIKIDLENLQILNKLSTASIISILAGSQAPIIFQSTSWLEKYAVAQNSNTPEDILQQLAGDVNRIVRAVAKANLAIKNRN